MFWFISFIWFRCHIVSTAHIFTELLNGFLKATRAQVLQSDYMPASFFNNEVVLEIYIKPVLNQHTEHVFNMKALLEKYVHVSRFLFSSIRLQSIEHSFNFIKITLKLYRLSGTNHEKRPLTMNLSFPCSPAFSVSIIYTEYKVYNMYIHVNKS